MPNKMDKELKRKFGAYLKVSILNAKKEYLIELNKIIKTETSLDEVDSIEDKAAERMLENVCIDYKIKDGEEFHARDVLNSIDDPTLYSAISALNTLQIEILVLRCIGKKTFREIGKLVGRSELKHIFQYTYKTKKNHRRKIDMGFRELLNRAKTMDDTAMVQIIELYNPLLYKYANVNSQFDQDLYEEFVYRLIICVVKFPY